MIKEELYTHAIEFLKQESGIDLGPGREQFLETRLQDMAKKNSFLDVNSLFEALKENRLSSSLKDDIINALTTNESYFFRDKKPFVLLEKECLPNLIARNKASKTLRIWSAAASNGQEAYSIAITILESFPELESWNLEILATDIDQSVLDYAKNGVYSSFEVNRGVDEKVRDKYFTQESGSWCVKDRIKKMVKFTKYNLMDPIPFNQTFDIILLRNVIIYFDKETKKRVLERFSQKMHQDSYLLLGGAESTQWITDAFQREMGQETTFYKLARPQNILVIDDEPEIAGLIKEILETNFARAINIDLAYDGLEGFDKCLKKEYSLVITDQFMPKLTGTEMIRKLFEKSGDFKSLNFLVVSGYVEDFKTNSPEIDHIYFIEKPFTEERIVRNVNLLLSKNKLCA